MHDPVCFLWRSGLLVSSLNSTLDDQWARRVVDEAHIVVAWGPKKKRVQAECYSNIQEWM